MKKAIGRNAVLLALAIFLCFAVGTKAETLLSYQSNGSTSVFPDNPPPNKLNTNGKPFVYYTLAANGQLTENYYDADGHLRYVLGSADEFYTETAWQSLTHPFPEPSAPDLLLQRLDDKGKIQSIQLLNDGRDIDVSYDRFGNKIIKVSEQFAPIEGEVTVSAPAITAYIYYEEHGNISTCRNKTDDDWTVLEYLFFYDDLMPDHLVSVTEIFLPDLENGPEHYNVYVFTYEGDKVKEIRCMDSDESEPDKYLTFYYSGDKRERVTLSEKNMDESTRIIEEYVYYYGEEDGTLWCLQKTKDGDIIEDYQMYYDEDGRIVEFMYTDYQEADFHSSFASFYAYDENGFLSEQADIRQTAENEDSETKTHRYFRNAEGEVTEIQTIDELTGELEEIALIEYRKYNDKAEDNPAEDEHTEKSGVIPVNADTTRSDEQYGELGTQTEVPYERIKLEVEEMVRSRFGSHQSYTFEAYHEPDEASHTDRVRIETTVYYPYGGYVTDWTNVFEYNRVSDLWSVFSTIYGQNWTAFWYPEKFIGIWYGTYMWDNKEGSFNLTIDEIDFDRMIMTGQYTMEHWLYDWNEKYQLESYENPLSEKGELPLVKKSGKLTIGVHEFHEDSTTYDFVFSPEHGVQFRDEYHGGKLMEAIKIVIVD